MLSRRSAGARQAAVATISRVTMLPRQTARPDEGFE